MGLYVQSLENIPANADRDYFIYLLDYGWDEPIRNALIDNFENMTKEAAKNRAVIIRGTEPIHFENQVFSWHQINGCNANDILPALLITNKHPAYFRDNNHGEKWNQRLYKESDIEDMKLILIPFKKFCTTTTEVVNLIQKIFSDIAEKKPLNDFGISKQMKKGIGKAIYDAIILEPSISGIGIDLKKLISNN